MKRIHGFLMIYVIMITILCGYMYMKAFHHTYKPTKSLTSDAQSKMMRKANNPPKYQLAIMHKRLVIINRATKEIFESTDIPSKELSKDIQLMLKHKKVFLSKEEVYHFLESLSS